MLSMEQNLKISWKDSFSRSKTGLNASMITFYVKTQCDKQHVDNWLRVYLLYLHMKTDRIRFTDFVIENALS
jgi:hypothetical protein